MDGVICFAPPSVVQSERPLFVNQREKGRFKNGGD